MRYIIHLISKESNSEKYKYPVYDPQHNFLFSTAKPRTKTTPTDHSHNFLLQHTVKKKPTQLFVPRTHTSHYITIAIMSNYSSSDKTPANNAASPSETLYNNKNPIRFAPRGTQNSINDGIVVLDPRPVQQWQLDAASARAEGTANNLETRLDSTTTAQLELNSEIALLRYEVDGMFDL
jgi:hypothetical protein